MRCRSFEQLAADWVAGRLPVEMAADMRKHRDACPACARTEALERTLSGAWASVREITERQPRELWPLVAARMEKPEPRYRAWFSSQRLALGGALTAGALCAMLLLARFAPSMNPAPPVADETRAITMAAAIQELPDPDREFTADSSRHVPLLQRAVLLGGGDQ